MSRKFAGVLVIALIVTACAGNGPTFKQRFAISQAQFRKLGADIVHDITGAGATTDAKLQSQFTGLAAQAHAQAARLSRLTPPASYRRRLSGLVTDFQALGGDLTGISAAAGRHDATSARLAMTTMLRDAAAIKSAAAGLSRSLGLPVR
jgi:hypothetical protein